MFFHIFLLLGKIFSNHYIYLECQETITALDQREKMLMSWQNAARMSKPGRIAGGQEDSLLDEQELAPSAAFAEEELTEFVTEEQYLADKGSRLKFILWNSCQ